MTQSLKRVCEGLVLLKKGLGCPEAMSLLIEDRRRLIGISQGRGVDCGGLYCVLMVCTASRETVKSLT